MWAFAFDTQRSDQLEMNRAREPALRRPEKADELAPVTVKEFKEC